MHRFTRALTFVFSVSLFGPVLGCSGDSDGADATEQVAGALSVEATIDPAGPAVGKSTLHIEISDADGQPVEGATLTVEPQMSMHGHGSPDVPVVTDLGGGNYDAFPVTLTMPGMWEVTVDVSMGDEQGTRVFEYQAQ